MIDQEGPARPLQGRNGDGNNGFEAIKLSEEQLASEKIWCSGCEEYHQERGFYLSNETGFCYELGKVLKVRCAAE